MVYEDDHVIAFLDIMPRTPGHTLVLPKEHAPTIVALPDEEVGSLFLAVKHIAALLSKKLKTDGITIGMNQGRASGQEVDHLHVHLMPRWNNDGGHGVQSAVYHESEESLEDIKKKILG